MPFKKTIPHDPYANVPIMRSAPGYSLFSTFCEETEEATKDDEKMMYCYANIADSTTAELPTFKEPTHDPVQMFQQVNKSEGEKLPESKGAPTDDLRDIPVLPSDFHDEEFNKEASPAPEASKCGQPDSRVACLALSALPHTICTPARHGQARHAAQAISPVRAAKLLEDRGEPNSPQTRSDILQ
jgi:hypothetical protein